MSRDVLILWQLFVLQEQKKLLVELASKSGYLLEWYLYLIAKSFLGCSKRKVSHCCRLIPLWKTNANQNWKDLKNYTAMKMLQQFF